VPVGGKIMKKIFSFDAETNGLWGRAFSLAAILYGEDGEEVARFVGRCPIQGDVNPWVRDNVLPQMVAVPETHSSYEELCGDFAAFYLGNRVGADVVVHMGVTVESRVLSDLHALGFIGDFDGPYPLLDLAGVLAMAGEDPTSVDSYVRKHGLSIKEFVGGTHNPLYDSEVAARVWMHLQARRDGAV
jgi:hypothetical protein